MLSRPRVDLEQPVLRFIETRDVLEVRSVDKLATGVVAPAMIPATKDSGRSRFFPGDCIRSMATDVVERSYDAVFSQDQEDGKARELEGVVVSGFCETTAVGDIEPCLFWLV